MRYANAENTSIEMANGRFVPVDPGNIDYVAIVTGGEVIAPFQPATAPALTRIAKADIWRRLTDEAAETLHTALLSAPLRLRLIFEAAQYLDTADDDYPALRAGIVAALGETSADEVLAPTY